MSPSPEAPAWALCRRLYLDLIGLPPSPEELEEFEQRGYDATVDKLLASERFGEKWGRHWMDVARYSDTNGYEKDLQREQWAWRDWVIDALNRDMPYDQFLIEQVAGDLLPNASQSQIIATGFLRNSMINEEGAIVPEQFRMVEMFDRMDCLGKAVLGLTTQCAQCHSHKFDPLTQDEYYGMFAFLNNTYEAQSWVYTAEQQQQIADIRGKIADAEQRLKASRPQWPQELAAWEQNLAARQISLGTAGGHAAGNHQRPESSHAGSGPVDPDERPHQRRRVPDRLAETGRRDRIAAGSPQSSRSAAQRTGPQPAGHVGAAGTGSVRQTARQQRLEQAETRQRDRRFLGTGAETGRRQESQRTGGASDRRHG